MACPANTKGTLSRETNPSRRATWTFWYWLDFCTFSTCIGFLRRSTIPKRLSDTLNLGWSASSDNKGVTGYKVFLNGGQVGTTGGLNYGYGGLACGTGYTLGVAAYDAAGNTSGVAAIGASTNGCPPPPPTVSVSKGGSAQGRPGCSSSACAYVVVSFANFSGGNHSISCESSVGHIYGPYSGGTPSAVCYFGYPGQTVWATVDGVRSNDLRW